MPRMAYQSKQAYFGICQGTMGSVRAPWDLPGHHGICQGTMGSVRAPWDLPVPARYVRALFGSWGSFWGGLGLALGLRLWIRDHPQLPCVACRIFECVSPPPRRPGTNLVLYALEWSHDHPAMPRPHNVIDWTMGTPVGVWGGACTCPDGRVYQVCRQRPSTDQSATKHANRTSPAHPHPHTLTRTPSPSSLYRPSLYPYPLSPIPSPVPHPPRYHRLVMRATCAAVWHAWAGCKATATRAREAGASVKSFVIRSSAIH